MTVLIIDYEIECEVVKSCQKSIVAPHDHLRKLGSSTRYCYYHTTPKDGNSICALFKSSKIRIIGCFLKQERKEEKHFQRSLRFAIQT